ncbi:hypothetical protein LCGC14_2219720 [marine sediment metagenome]|uniref:Uncharacterized protein n=1 Tax=marine sediment metagenome TaxID=412755 RepID=A0A0F9DYW9_9ZZZZ
MRSYVESLNRERLSLVRQDSYGAGLPPTQRVDVELHLDRVERMLDKALKELGVNQDDSLDNRVRRYLG